MNKKYLSAILFGALLASSTGTFTSCKDYDDDIKGLQEQIDGNQTSVAALEKQLATLDAAAKAAQTAADAAKTAADAAATAAAKAQAAGDQAAADAATAKALAEAAQAAAEKAKVDAIAEATKQVTALKTLMEQSLASKIEQADLDVAIAAVNAQIEGIQKGLGQLISDNTAKIVENANDIKDAKEAIANLIAADEDLKIQIEGLANYDKILKELIDKNGLAIEENATNIDAAKAKIEDAQNEINELWKNLNDSNEQIAQLFTLISENKAAIDENGNKIEANTSLIEALTARVEDLETTTGGLLTTTAEHKKLIEALEKRVGLNEDAITKLNTGLSATNKSISTLETKINAELTTIKGDIGKIGNQINNIVGMISEINGSLNSLHTLIVCRLTSITLAPDLFVDGIEAVRFTSLQYSPMDKDENASIPATSYKFSTAALATASYHFNPASFNLDNATYSYADRTAEVVSTTRAIGSKLVEIAEVKGEDGKNLPNPSINLENGTVEFKLLRLNSHTTQPGLDRTNMIALQATLKDANIEGAKDGALDASSDNAVITSPYVAVYDAILSYEDVRIADKETLTTGADKAHYATTFDACKKEDPRYKMDYNKEFNLKELVATCFGNNGHDEFPIEDYNLSYRFAVATSEFNITTGSTTTNQQKWIKCNDAKEGLYQAEDFSKEAIGRTPILKVELVDATGNVVRRGFVKVQIGVTKSDDMTLPVILDPLTYQCNTTKATYEMSVDYIRENLYRKIANSLGETGMSHEEFWKTYDANSAIATVTKNGVVCGVPVPRIVDGPTGSGVSTKKIVWSFTHGDLGQIGSGSTFVASVTVKNTMVSSAYPAAVTFRFTIDVKLPTLTEKLTKADTYWTLAGTSPDDFDVNVAIPAPKDDVPENCQFKQNLDVAYTVDEPSGKFPECVTDYYEIIETKSNGKATSTILSGVKIDGREISLDKNDAAVKAALNSDGGLQAVVKHAYRLENGESLSVHSFVVNFIRPVNLNMPGEISLRDAKSGGDVANFQHDRLLTDWRGEAITNGYYVPVTGSVSYWDFNYTPKYERVDGHYELEQEAKLEVITKDVSFTAARPVTMFTATATYKNIGYDENGEPNGEEQTATFTAEAETQADADNGIRAQLLAYNWSVDGYYTSGAYQVEETSYTERVILKGELVEYTYVADIKYTPAKYHWVDGTWEEVKHEHTGTPDYNGTTEGQTGGCGCYIWKTYTVTTDQEVGRNFWYFYGPIGDVKLDVTKATTNLKDGKLPAQSTLVQDGNTVKYENILSPVGYEYKIFIPATVTYGWGTATSQLTIIVKPVRSN